MRRIVRRRGGLVFGGLMVGLAWYSHLCSAAGTTQPAQPARGRATAQMWDGVRQGIAKLDADVAARHLEAIHEAAYAVRDSTLRLLAAAPGAGVGTAALKTLTGQVATLAEELDESGDKNDLRATAGLQARLHVAVDAIAALYPSGVLKQVGPVVATGTVPCAVCRMPVDAATALSQVVDGRAYYFCSKEDATTFAHDPHRYVALFDDITYGAARHYTISLTPTVTAGGDLPVPLVFTVREAGKSGVVSQFQRVHEKLLHLIMVSDDLSWFAHQHPWLAPDGRFYLSWRFPHAGRYWLFADFTPADGENQILRTTLQVGAAAPHAMVRLQPDTLFTRAVDGYSVDLKMTPPLTAGKPSLLTYTISRDGKPVSDMEPFLGVMGHLMAISQDGGAAVHTHVVGAGSADGLTVTPEMATASGPSFTYKLRVPKPGLYKIWAQFQRAGHVITVPFVVGVG